MLAMFSELPIDLDDVHKFEALLRSCDKQFNGTRPSVSSIEYDTNYDPDLVSASSSILLSVVFTYLLTLQSIASGDAGVHSSMSATDRED